MKNNKGYDVCLIGSGPNALAAAAVLAKAGAKVLVLESASNLGGGLRSAELTLPGFQHDVCAAAHPMGIVSPVFKMLPLEQHGLTWIKPKYSAAHPLIDQPAVLLQDSIQETAESLGTADGKRYIKMLRPFLDEPQSLLEDVLAPLGMPNHPITFSRFGLKAIQPATWHINRFQGERAKALFAGCAAHSILPLNHLLTGAMGVIFSLLGHVDSWPIVKGGSQKLADALVSYAQTLGVEFGTDYTVTDLSNLPPTKAVLFDTSPNQLISTASNFLPASYLKRIANYRYGPGVFKVDWALNKKIPWQDKSCQQAGTIHLGGTAAEIIKSERDMFSGKANSSPFVMLVQQSNFDATRSPNGQHTGYAYCHVPAGSTEDMSEAIENQIERFAPGFKESILASHKKNAMDFQRYNLNYVGGAITGGIADFPQALFRPIFKANPYTTPNKHIFIGSASTPPGGGVHGMCGFYAAKTILKQLPKLGNL